MFISGNLNSILSRRADASAILNGSKKYPKLKGNILFFKVSEGVLVRTEVSGLPDEKAPCRNRIFALHIHAGNSCAGTMREPFAGTLMHYNPDNCPHPYHAGDLPPLFSVNGEAFSVVLTGRISLKEILNRTIVIHSAPDDFTSQPAGNSGEKIACGVILPVR